LLLKTHAPSADERFCFYHDDDVCAVFVDDETKNQKK
jgi:hypothetical protein